MCRSLLPEPHFASVGLDRQARPAAVNLALDAVAVEIARRDGEITHEFASPTAVGAEGQALRAGHADFDLAAIHLQPRIAGDLRALKSSVGAIGMKLQPRADHRRF